MSFRKRLRDLKLEIADAATDFQQCTARVECVCYACKSRKYLARDHRIDASDALSDELSEFMTAPLKRRSGPGAKGLNCETIILCRKLRPKLNITAQIAGMPGTRKDFVYVRRESKTPVLSTF
jgi:hypothetical protein